MTETNFKLGEEIMTLSQMYRQEGEHHKSLAIAQNLLRKGLDPALIAETTGVDLRILEEMEETTAAAVDSEKT